MSYKIKESNFKKNSINVISGFPSSVRENEEVLACRYFAEKYLTHSSNKFDKRLSSHELKLMIKNWLIVCYHCRANFTTFGNHKGVSNEAVIVALAELGFKSSPNEPDSPFLYFKFKYTGPKFWNGCGYEMPCTEADWEKILKVA